MPPDGDPSVRKSQRAAHSGQVREGPERPRPPNLPREINDGVGAAELPAVVRQQAQFGEKFLLGE